MDSNASPHDAEAMTPAVEPIRPWLRQNLVNLVIGAALLGLVLWKLHIVDVLLAIGGLTLIIFVHELGHFVAAKLCKVRVKTFSFFGLGPAIPGLAWKYGETTYQVSIVPLGGYVSMVGEGDNAEGDEAENDPRSFKNQSVGERMLIISAGVFMNILLAMVLFVIVYRHGLPESPAVIGTLEPGGALWRHNVHSQAKILRIGTHENLWFEDVRPLVWNTDEGEKLDIAIRERGEIRTLAVEPRKEPGAPFPLLGFAPPQSMTLYNHPRDPSPPYRLGSAAAKSGLFEQGDTILATSLPGGSQLMPLEGDFPWFDFERRMAKAAGQPVTVQVRRSPQRGGEELTVTLPPEFRKETGLRMRMGPIIAVRDDSPAARAGLRGAADGDRIVEVEFANRIYAADFEAKRKNNPNADIQPLDPLRLPWLLLKAQREQSEPLQVMLTVLRSVDHSEKRVTLPLTWDTIGAADLGEGGAATTPVAINGLGFAYQVQAVIDGSTVGDFQPGDVVEAVRYITTDEDGTLKESRWEDVQPGQWAFVDRVIQNRDPHTIDVRVDRGGQKLEARLVGTPDPTCPVHDRGLLFMLEYRDQKASSIGEALSMGFHRTIRALKTMYINLYAMAFGRVSIIQTMSGPITLARLSYKIAGESSYKLLLLLALISINLAVVNFLPIPVLDGGHMMFLIYEGLAGRPPPERVHWWLSILGFVCVACLMAFVVGLDLWRLIKMWLGW